MSPRNQRLRHVASNTFLASSALVASLIGAAAVACSAGDEGTDGPPNFNPLNPGAGGGASGPNGSAGVGGARPATGTGGTSGLSGTSGGGGAAPVAGSGGAVNMPQGGGGQSNNPSAGGSGSIEPGAGGSNGGGGFVSVDVDGGASAKHVCPAGVTFGNPLQGMGQVQQVGAPQGSFFSFIEGPIWVGSLNRLFFSDNVSPERIFQTSPPFSATSLFLANSGSNGLALDNDDQLLLADQAARRITRVNPMNAQVTGTLLPAGSPRPNDLILRSDNNLYFTDPASGLFRVSPSGQLSAAVRGGQAPQSPNGVVLSPDENILYAGDVNASFIAKFNLLADGSIDTASATRFTGTRSGIVDGMAVDCAGNVYAGTGNGVEVYTAGGQFINTIASGQCSNATFGGADRKTLFITSGNQLKFVTLAVPGLPD